mmetsp:Transcript_17862/g.62692  ORF Transcript_17862/g.62692 Transcript_17862/m.62692 type:complete len:271 (+) Transcript_17862:2029-2841(+)
MQRRGPPGSSEGAVHNGLLFGKALVDVHTIQPTDWQRVCQTPAGLPDQCVRVAHHVSDARVQPGRLLVHANDDIGLQDHFVRDFHLQLLNLQELEVRGQDVRALADLRLPIVQPIRLYALVASLDNVRVLKPQLLIFGSLRPCVTPLDLHLNQGLDEVHRANADGVESRQRHQVPQAQQGEMQRGLAKLGEVLLLVVGVRALGPHRLRLQSALVPVLEQENLEPHQEFAHVFASEATSLDLDPLRRQYIGLPITQVVLLPHVGVDASSCA